jgi:uncharacterized membrane protein (DUF4010 family)
MESLTRILSFLLAGALGALIGLERAIHHQKEMEREDVGGIRTFTLTSWLGWVATQLSSTFPWIFLIVFLAFTALIIWDSSRHSSRGGITTELAFFLTFLIGSWVGTGAYRFPTIVTVGTLSILALKEPIWKITRHITQEDLYAGLQFLIIALVVLPVLPEEPIDPWGLWKLKEIGFIFFFLNLLSFLSYLLLRFIGEERGILLLAVAGGIVSSTTTTLNFSMESKKNPALGSLMGFASSLSSFVMLPRAFLIVYLLYPPLGDHLLIPVLSCIGGNLLLLTWLYRRFPRPSTPVTKPLTPKNPVEILRLLRYTLLLGGIIGFARFASKEWGSEGIFLTSLFAGLVDVDGISIALAQESARTGQFTPYARGFLLALCANTVVKTFLLLLTADRSARKNGLFPLLLTFLILGGFAFLWG